MKKIRDYLFEINKKLRQQEIHALISLARLDGKIENSDFKESYEFIIILKEVLNSNQIENIHTTYSHLLEASVGENNIENETKSVSYNIEAIREGIEYIKENNFLDKKIFIKIKQIITKNNQGIRTIPGTVIIDKKEIVYKPPQSYDEINFYLNDLEEYLNDQESDLTIGFLCKMSLCHFQFESIHPFSDCNGRAGRIINILFLILKKIITMSIIPLSYFINKNKEDYYQQLKASNQDEKNISNFILYMLNMINKSSIYGSQLLNEIGNIYNKNWEKIKKILPKIKYNSFLKIFNNVTFDYNSFIKNFNISRNTAISYIEKLVSNQIIIPVNSKNTFFILKDVLEKITKE